MSMLLKSSSLSKRSAEENSQVGVAVTLSRDEAGSVPLSAPEAGYVQLEAVHIVLIVHIYLSCLV